MIWNMTFSSFLSTFSKLIRYSVQSIVEISSWDFTRKSAAFSPWMDSMRSLRKVESLYLVFVKWLKGYGVSWSRQDKRSLRRKDWQDLLPVSQLFRNLLTTSHLEFPSQSPRQWSTAWNPSCAICRILCPLHILAKCSSWLLPPTKAFLKCSIFQTSNLWVTRRWDEPGRWALLLLHYHSSRCIGLRSSTKPEYPEPPRHRFDCRG